jgi:hypothetical protein
MSDKITQDQDTGQVHTRGETYGKVFDALMHDPDVSDGAVRLYAHMHWRYGRTRNMFQGRAGMGEQLYVDKKTIDRRIAELASKDWIVVIWRKSEDRTYTTNKDHVFESPADAKEFRREYKPEPGETVAPKPKASRVKRRERRAARKANTPRDKIDATLASKLTPNTDSVYLDSVKNTPAVAEAELPAGVKPGSYAAVHGLPNGKTLEQLDEEAAQLTRDLLEQNEYKKRMALEQDDLMLAVLKVFNAGGGYGGEQGMYMRMLRGVVKNTTPKRKKPDEFDLQAPVFAARPVTAAELMRWAQFYREENPSAAMLRVPHKVASSIDAWRRLYPSAESQAAEFTLVESPATPTPPKPAAPVDRNQVAKELAALRRNGRDK